MAAPLSPKSLMAQIQVSAHLHSLAVLDFWPEDMRSSIASTSSPAFNASELKYRPAGLGLGATAADGSIPRHLREKITRKSKVLTQEEKVGKSFVTPKDAMEDHDVSSSSDSEGSKWKGKPSTSSMKRNDPFAIKKPKKKLKPSASSSAVEVSLPQSSPSHPPSSVNGHGPPSPPPPSTPPQAPSSPQSSNTSSPEVESIKQFTPTRSLPVQSPSKLSASAKKRRRKKEKKLTEAAAAAAATAEL